MLLVVGLLGIFIVIPAQTTTGEIYGLPPSLFPTIGAVLMSACCGLKITLTVIRGSGDDEAAVEPMTGRHWLHIAAVTAGLIVSLVLIEQLGFLIGGPVAVAVFMLYMGSRKPLTLVAVAIGAPLAIYLFFWQLLSIPLP